MITNFAGKSIHGQAYKRARYLIPASGDLENDEEELMRGRL